jgi:sec-independent protein translocase protein TatA
MGRIGGGELLLILLIALLVFGPSKLADMGKGLGEGLKNFKKGLSPEDEAKKAPEPAPAPQPPMSPPAAAPPKTAEPAAAQPPSPDPPDKDKKPAVG